MPYIAPDRRAALDPIIAGLVGRLQKLKATKGDVNYCACEIALAALKPHAGWNYQSLSDAVAALQDAADEIKRRCLAPYEDLARTKNGDISEFFSVEQFIAAKLTPDLLAESAKLFQEAKKEALGP